MKFLGGILRNGIGNLLHQQTRPFHIEHNVGHVEHCFAIFDKAREEGARLLNDARAAIEQEKAAAIADIRKQVATLSVEIAEKVLRQNLQGDKAQMDLINRMLDDVSTDK